MIIIKQTNACLITSVVSDSVHPFGLQPARLLCPWDSPGKNTGVGCHAHVSCIGRHVLYHWEANKRFKIKNKVNCFIKLIVKYVLLITETTVVLMSFISLSKIMLLFIFLTNNLSFNGIYWWWEKSVLADWHFIWCVLPSLSGNLPQFLHDSFQTSPHLCSFPFLHLDHVNLFPPSFAI